MKRGKRGVNAFLFSFLVSFLLLKTIFLPVYFMTACHSDVRYCQLQPVFLTPLLSCFVF